MDGGQATGHMAIWAGHWGGRMYTCLGCTSWLVTSPLILVDLLVTLTLVHVIVLICGAGNWSSDGQVAILYIVHCQSPVIVFYPSVLCWLPVLAGWSHCTISCLLWWLPGWSLCLCIMGGDLVHTTKVSHNVCALFLACPLPWMGHLVVRQEQARSHWVYIYVSFVNK